MITASIIAEIQRAVEERRECSALDELDARELRALLHELVRIYKGGPAEVFRELVVSVVGASANVADERRSSGLIRRKILEEVRSVLLPALPALLGPIYVEEIQSPKRQVHRVAHPIVRGLRLSDGERWSSAGAGTKHLTGRSWWIVAIPPVDQDDEMSARYAFTEHSGSVTEEEGGRVACRVEVCSVDMVASQIRDDKFVDILTGVHERLTTTTSSNERMARQLARSSDVLRRCLAAAR
jgi:hypothetical protein